MRALTLATLLVPALLLLAATSASAHPRRGTMVERAVFPPPARAHGVQESYVHVYEPLPKADGPHPAHCDWLGYLRFRHAGGPANPSNADAVFVSMPGIFAGASMHDQVGRNAVRRAARRGKDLEYWALDRRANCLEDHRGIEAAARHRSAKLAFDYYWGDRKVPFRCFYSFL